jgi:hypothetical protein
VVYLKKANDQIAEALVFVIVVVKAFFIISRKVGVGHE